MSLPGRCLALLAALALLLGPVSALYKPGGVVEMLEPRNFKKYIKESKGVWLVEFYAPWCGHCQNLVPEYEKAARALLGVVNVGAVDADAHRELAAPYDVRGFPTIKLLYTNKKGEIKSIDYNGGRTAKDMVAWAMGKATSLVQKRLSGGSGSGSGSAGGSGGDGGGSGFYSGTDVVELTPQKYAKAVESSDPWFIEFYAPWCGHCKALKPAWTEAARALKGRVKVGALNCDEHKAACDIAGVQGFPTIKFYGQNKDVPEDYNGARDAPAIIEFAETRAAALVKPPEPTELTSQAVFDETCGGQHPQGERQLCFIAFLPNILDTRADGRYGYIEMLKEVARRHPTRPYALLWAEGAKQPAVEQSLEVGGFGYPALVAYSPKRKAFAIHKGAVDPPGVLEFVDRVSKGFAQVVPLSGRGLGSVADVAPWDGGDGEEVLDEEIPLEELFGDE
ncbi:unnamed protein product [Pedinophyceae sp. YPF-701]|nr:unnamed protein product [Pedinophyceae sp. YPF-701]